MNRKQRHYFYKAFRKDVWKAGLIVAWHWEFKSVWPRDMSSSPITAARRRARNRQLARHYFGLKSKRHAKRFAEVSL